MSHLKNLENFLPTHNIICWFHFYKRWPMDVNIVYVFVFTSARKPHTLFITIISFIYILYREKLVQNESAHHSDDTYNMN